MIKQMQGKVTRCAFQHSRVLCRSVSALTPAEAGRRAEELAEAVKETSKSIDTRLAHSGIRPGPNAALSPPLHFATTYTRPSDGEYLEGDAIYSRHDNPTRLMLEREMAVLECTTGDSSVSNTDDVVSCAFSSGMMAASAIVLAHRAPLHVILPTDLYHGVPTVLRDVFSRFQVVTESVHLQDPLALEEALVNIPVGSDVIVWMETPSNPLCHVIDIEEICSTARRIRGDATLVVDSTLAPPVLTQPLLLGADIVMHSATKYLAGHSDALVGVVTSSPWTTRGQEMGPLLHQVQVCTGGVASAMDSWLALRGMRSLVPRVERQCKTAMDIACFLEEHPLVDTVHYPGLASHPSNDVATRQMKGGYGGVLSVDMATEQNAMALAGALKTIRRATSLGGTETLIEHRSSIEPEGRVTSPVGLLRLSVGLEDPEDLKRDLACALRIVGELQ